MRCNNFGHGRRNLSEAFFVVNLIAFFTYQIFQLVDRWYQRARALMRQPRLLCIDEPSMGLSPRYVDTVYDALFSLRDEGLTILMVEQNANRALELAHRAYILRAGYIAKSGSASDLRHDPEVKRAYLGG